MWCKRCASRLVTNLMVLFRTFNSIRFKLTDESSSSLFRFEEGCKNICGCLAMLRSCSRSFIHSTFICCLSSVRRQRLSSHLTSSQLFNTSFGWYSIWMRTSVRRVLHVYSLTHAQAHMTRHPNGDHDQREIENVCECEICNGEWQWIHELANQTDKSTESMSAPFCESKISDLLRTCTSSFLLFGQIHIVVLRSRASQQLGWDAIQQREVLVEIVLSLHQERGREKTEKSSLSAPRP